MADAKYNGWTNYETWLANLWMGDVFAEMQEDGATITADLIKSVILDMMQDAYGRSDSKSVESGFMLDMLNCALGEINYHELADHYRVEEAQ